MRVVGVVVVVAVVAVVAVAVVVVVVGQVAARVALAACGFSRRGSGGGREHHFKRKIKWH